VQEFLFNTASGAPFHEKTHELVTEGYTSTQISRDRMLLVALATFLGMGVGLLVLSALVMLPVLYTIDRSRDAVLENFLHVPVPVLEVLKTSVDRGLKSMHRETDGEADSEDEEEEEDGRPPTGGRGSGGGGGGGSVDLDNALAGGGSVPGGGVSDGGDVNWEALFARLSAQSQAAAATAARRTGATAARPSFRGNGDAVAGGADVLAPSRRASAASLSPTVNVPLLGSGGGKKAVKSWRSYAGLLAFLLPNVAMLLLYGAVYGVTVTSTSNFVNLQRMFTIASFRGTQTPEVVMNLRRAIMYIGFGYERALHYDGAWGVLHELTAEPRLPHVRHAARAADGAEGRVRVRDADWRAERV